MRKLVDGIIEFQNQLTPARRDRFAALALEQRPDALFFACSDSRVAPNVFASTNPGDLFVVRNVGNMIPACDLNGHSVSDQSEAAAIEFAVGGLGVKDIIVCGHSECGAMRALLDGTDNIPWPNLKGWVDSARPALARWQEGEIHPAELSDVNLLSQLNVLEQISHLYSYPMVREKVAAKKIGIHAWWFDIANAQVLAFDTETRQFRPIGSWTQIRASYEFNKFITCHHAPGSPCVSATV